MSKSTFWRLRKRDHVALAHHLKREFPEKMNRVDYEELWDAIRFSGLEIYEKEKAPKSIWIRLTLPLGLVVGLLLLLCLPINYIVTGYWGYRWLWLKNWFSSLGF